MLFASGHGARGHSRRHKCPLWMSSTQVGKLETNWAEGAVAGGLWAASAAANATLWALATSWNKGSQSLQQAEWCARKYNCHFTPEITKSQALRSSHREYEKFLFAIPPTLHWVFLIRGVSLVANGSGERERDAGGAPPAALQARARFYWQLVISKPICGRHGARGHSRRHKCPA